MVSRCYGNFILRADVNIMIYERLIFFVQIQKNKSKTGILVNFLTCFRKNLDLKIFFSIFVIDLL